MAGGHRPRRRNVAWHRRRRSARLRGGRKRGSRYAGGGSQSVAARGRNPSRHPADRAGQEQRRDADRGKQCPAQRVGWGLGSGFSRDRISRRCRRSNRRGRRQGRRLSASGRAQRRERNPVWQAVAPHQGVLVEPACRRQVLELPPRHWPVRLPLTAEIPLIGHGVALRGKKMTITDGDRPLHSVHCLRELPAEQGKSTAIAAALLQKISCGYAVAARNASACRTPHVWPR